VGHDRFTDSCMDCCENLERFISMTCSNLILVRICLSLYSIKKELHEFNVLSVGYKEVL